MVREAFPVFNLRLKGGRRVPSENSLTEGLGVRLQWTQQGGGRGQSEELGESQASLVLTAYAPYQRSSKSCRRSAG
jgi:hypothetical protein